MTNKEIAAFFKQTAKLLELHGENPFKVRGYQSNGFNLEKIDTELNSLSIEELVSIDGINKSTASKIEEITSTGNFSELARLLEQTPAGVIEMLEIPGIGPKKVKTLWQELNLESIDVLKTACLEDKIAGLKGFGTKTQQTILDGIQFLEQQSGKFLFAEIDSYSHSVIELIKQVAPNLNIELVGDAKRKLEIIDELEYCVESDNVSETIKILNQIHYFQYNPISSTPFVWRGNDTTIGIALTFHLYGSYEFKKQVFRRTASTNHLKQLVDSKSIYQHLQSSDLESDEAFYNSIGYHYIIPEAREGHRELLLKNDQPNIQVIDHSDLKGVLHNHSTYSDGRNTISEMVDACQERGYEYFGISDHSVTASYAGGLDIDRVEQQHREVDAINQELNGFKVFKGIESDILNDGSLDYPEEVLKTFDFIVSSIHSNLKMDISTGTERLLKATENPYTTFLGHATGRLLLKRDGYPLDFKRIIDACADNGVIIEINANPRRLDVDWRWMDYILEKNVMLAINPDAHITTGFDDMQYGVHVARKALVPTEMIFNSRTKEEADAYFSSRKK